MAKAWKDALRTIQPYCISNYLIGRFTNTCQILLATSFFLSFFLFSFRFSRWINHDFKTYHD